MKLPVLFLLACLALASVAVAAEIKIVSAVPVGEGIQHIAEQYKKTSGHDVKVQIANTGEINKLLAANEPFDILIGTTASADQAAKEGKATAATKTQIGRIGIGVIVRSSSAAPNVATVDALKQALLKADLVIYNRAGSGQYIEKMIGQLGLTDQLKGKIPATRPGNAGETMDQIMQSKVNEIGFGLLSEIKPYESKGIKLAGRLPAELQNYGNYDAIIMTNSKSVDAARDFIRYLTTPAAKQVFATHGVD
jgi:molybdate transport system substrate-binding protein